MNSFRKRIGLIALLAALAMLFFLLVPGIPSRHKTDNSQDPVIVFIGDSLTHGLGGSRPYTSWIKFPSYHGHSFEVINNGVNGAAISLDDPRYSIYGIHQHINRDLYPYFHPHSDLNVVVLWAGTNDSYYGLSMMRAFYHLCQYGGQARQRGWRVVVLTMIPRGQRLRFQPALYNFMIRSFRPLFADALVDVAADPRLGAAQAYSNGEYYRPDRCHLNDRGYQVVAGMVQQSLEQIVSRAGRNI